MRWFWNAADSWTQVFPLCRTNPVLVPVAVEGGIGGWSWLPNSKSLQSLAKPAQVPSVNAKPSPTPASVGLLMLRFANGGFIRLGSKIERLENRVTILVEGKLLDPRSCMWSKSKVWKKRSGTDVALLSLPNVILPNSRKHSTWVEKLFFKVGINLEYESKVHWKCFGLQVSWSWTLNP